MNPNNDLKVYPWRWIIKNLLAIPGCLRSNTCICHSIAVVSKHTLLVSASKRKSSQFLACIESIVDLGKSTLTNDVKGNLTWQTNKRKCTINMGEGEANVTACFILNVKLRNVMGTPFNFFGWTLEDNGYYLRQTQWCCRQFPWWIASVDLEVQQLLIGDVALHCLGITTMTDDNRTVSFGVGDGGTLCAERWVAHPRSKDVGPRRTTSGDAVRWEQLYSWWLLLLRLSAWQLDPDDTLQLIEGG